MPSPRAAMCCLLLCACGSRTGLGDEPFAIDALACQETPYRGRPGATLTLYAALPRAAAGLARWEVVARPAGAPVPSLAHSGGNAAMFRADVEGTYGVRVTVPASADAGADESCVMGVVVRAMGPVALCPPELTTAPMRPVAIAGSAQGDRRVVSYGWSFERVPATSARPAPRPDDRAATVFTPDVAGDYSLRLRVTDDAGASDECVTVVHAVPSEGLRVELVWDPPGRSCPTNEGAACDRSDVDLHLLRDPGRGLPWRSGDDCHWLNCNRAASRSISWGAPGVADDPRLDIDDVTGHGPENINIDRPSERAYRIGVHYFDAHDGGPQAATVVVYCGSSEPVARLGPLTLSYRGSADESDFWLAADVLLRGAGGCEVRPISLSGAPWVTTYLEAQRGAGPPAP